MITKGLMVLACAAGFCGCASTGPIPNLSDARCQELVTAADQFAVVGGPLPEAVVKLNPVQVYGDHGNMVIALQRNDLGEQGFYIVPTTSSFDPRYGPHRGWTFKLVNPSDPYLSNFFAYSRHWKD